jgi:DNA-binding transcriptional MerR regulator
VKLKKLYSSREVAVMTGLTARQLQWWDARRLFTSAVASQRTQAGGFTERRYTPLDVMELQVLAELRRRGFSIPRLRRLLGSLRDVFGIRLYEAIGADGPVTLMVSGSELYARTSEGTLFDMEHPTQAMLMSEEGLGLRVLLPRERRARTPALRSSTGSGRSSRGRRRGEESRGRR